MCILYQPVAATFFELRQGVSTINIKIVIKYVI